MPDRAVVRNDAPMHQSEGYYGPHLWELPWRAGLRMAILNGWVVL